MSPLQIQEANLPEASCGVADQDYGVTVAETPCLLSAESLAAVQQVNPTSESPTNGRDIYLYVLRLALSA